MPSGENLARSFEKAERLRNQGYFDRAAAIYRKVLAAAESRDPELYIESCLSLASVHRSLGAVKQARRYLAQAGRLARKLRTAEFEDRLALEDALVDRAAGAYAKALKKLKVFLARFKRERDFSGAAFILWATGGARRFSGDLKGAERDFHQSLRFAKRAKDVDGQVYALFGLGGVTRIEGRLEESRKFYAEAGKQLKGSDDVFGRAYAHCGLANALRQLGRWDEARKNYVRSHRLYSSLGDKVDLAYVDWGLGKIALQHGEFSHAQDCFRKALQGFAWGDEARGLALTQGSLAALEHARSNTKAAESWFARSLDTAKKAGLRTYLEPFT